MSGEDWFLLFIMAVNFLTIVAVSALMFNLWRLRRLYQEMRGIPPRCLSWRIRGFRPVRCKYLVIHVNTSKYHESAKGHIWRVKQRYGASD